MKTLLTASALLLTISSFGAEGWLVTVNESDQNRVTFAEKSNRIDPFADPAEFLILNTGQHQNLTTYTYPPSTGANAWTQPRDVIGTEVVEDEFEQGVMVTNILTQVVPWKYVTADIVNGFLAMDEAGRTAVDDAEAVQARANLLATGETSYPVLDEHPDPSEVGDGIFYHIQNGDVRELWFVRSSDSISTQLSAHDLDGKPINRTFSLETRTETTYALEPWFDTLKQSDKDKVKDEEHKPKKEKP